MAPKRRAAPKAQKRRTPARSRASAAEQPIADAPRTEGQRLLLAVSGTHVDVAAKIDASKQSVQEWRSGRKTPAAAARARIAKEFGIDPGAWAQTPGSSAPPAPLPELGGEREHLEELLRDLRALRADRNLTPSERARVAGEENKTLRRLADLKAAAELSEPRFVNEHPRWHEIRTVVLRALEPHPDAARDVMAALQAIGA